MKSSVNVISHRMLGFSIALGAFLFAVNITASTENQDPEKLIPIAAYDERAVAEISIHIESLGMSASNQSSFYLIPEKLATSAERQMKTAQIEHAEFDKETNAGTVFVLSLDCEERRVIFNFNCKRITKRKEIEREANFSAQYFQQLSVNKAQLSCNVSWKKLK